MLDDYRVDECKMQRKRWLTFVILDALYIAVYKRSYVVNIHEASLCLFRCKISEISISFRDKPT